MKLITLNAWQGRIFRNLAPYFTGHPTDILCLQELTSSQHSVGPWDLFGALEAIAPATGLATTYFSPAYGFEFMGSPVKFGNAVLTNYPVVSKSTIFTGGEYADLKHPDDYQPGTRNAQIIRLSTPLGELTVVNHHGHREVDKRGSQVSLDKLKKLATELKSIRGPLIVAGDFNLSADSEAVQHFKKTLGLADLTYDYGLTDTLSSAVIPIAADCDHIFVSSHIRVKSFTAETAVLSDHKALILEFEF